MSSEKNSSGALQELGGHQVGERHRHAARRPDRGGLRAGQTQPAGARHPTQRLRDRGDDTEVGTRADHDDGAAGPQSADRRAQPAGRRADAVAAW